MVSNTKNYLLKENLESWTHNPNIYSPLKKSLHIFNFFFT